LFLIKLLNMQTVLITGGTGLIGKALTKHLTAKGYKVAVLTRKKPQVSSNKIQNANIEYGEWNVATQTIDIKAVQKADHIIHLAGAGVMDKRWSEAYKKEIVESRTKSSELIFNTLKNNSNSVKTIVSASAIGWYGPDIITGKYFVETDEADKSFLGETCRLWEANIEPVEQLGKRLVKLRTGIVFSNDGGDFVEFKKSLQFGVAAILGNGKQIISWIHIDDLCKLYINAIENEKLSGSYNAVAPEPIANKQLIVEIAKKIKGKFFIPAHVPEFVLKIILGEQSIEVLKSTTVSCEKIRQTGFSFLYPTVEMALTQLCDK
jgi:uncharacterized protein (TIGR01777 family)